MRLSSLPRSARSRPSSSKSGSFPRFTSTVAPKRLIKSSYSTLSSAEEALSLRTIGVSEAEDYYSILGITPEATTADIRKAYIQLMKVCHPDLAASSSESLSGDDVDDLNDLCKLLNEVYHTLTDPERRAEYDEISGFAAGAINPFYDDRYEPASVFVDEGTCIGCRNCNNVCANTFTMEDDFGRARVFQQDGDTPEKIQEAIDTCPVSCIHWVTAPQLALLESEMRQIERRAVHALMTNPSQQGPSVFAMAELAWEKRRAASRGKAQASIYFAKSDSSSSSAPRPPKSVWEAFTRFTDARSDPVADAEEARRRDQEADPSGRQATARAAADAARKWRDFSRRVRDRPAAPKKVIGHLSISSSVVGGDGLGESIDVGQGVAAPAAAPSASQAAAVVAAAVPFENKIFPTDF